MAALLMSASRPEEAAVYYRRLATEWADVPCLGGKTGKQIIADLPADSPESRAGRIVRLAGRASEAGRLGTAESRAA